MDSSINFNDKTSDTSALVTDYSAATSVHSSDSSSSVNTTTYLNKNHALKQAQDNLKTSAAIAKRPSSIKETGLSEQLLLQLLIKTYLSCSCGQRAVISRKNGIKWRHYSNIIRPSQNP